MIGDSMRLFLEELLELADRTGEFKVHFATAREAFNIAMAAVDGQPGEELMICPRRAGLREMIENGLCEAGFVSARLIAVVLGERKEVIFLLRVEAEVSY